MFDNLTARLARIIRDLGSEARLTEADIDAVLRDVRVSLLEADVALPVVRDLIEHIRARAVGAEVLRSLTPGQAVVKIVRDELIQVLGGTASELRLEGQAPVVVLLAGLQGAGKTTTAAKLGRWLIGRKTRRILLAGCDTYRPAAPEQLKLLAGENGLECFVGAPGQSPVAIASAALQLAHARLAEVLIVDSAGRLHVDEEMMAEIRQLHEVLRPSDTLFVVDSMLGQDAVNAAASFSSSVPLSGIILTKVDGDSRGGAALSVRHVTGVPILFIGTGERVEELAPFHPDRMASRILGMGDVLTLIEQVERGADREKSEQIARKVIKGAGFDLTDFRDQLRRMRSLGGLAGMIEKLPLAQFLPGSAAAQFNDRELVRLESIINSMTPAERGRPEIINGSRKKRIAAGSGTQIQDVNRLLKQFQQMQTVMKRLTRKGGMARMMRTLGSGPPRGFRR
ncbi:MAG: signal recognition particle protein [Gammaproteobacteria bacterium]|nr:signal recognition particle protein [Gammaproteobacteria bacterium]